MEPTGTAALRRIASELSGTDELQHVFEDVLDDAIRLFQLDRAAIWLWNPGHEPALEMAAGRNVPPELRRRAAEIASGFDENALETFRAGTALVYRDSGAATLPPEIRSLYAKLGIMSICVVPAVFRHEPVGYFIFYHERPFEWNDEQVGLAQSLGDSVATAIGNARLVQSVQSLVARLRAVQDLSAQLSGIQDVRGIGEAIVAEARALVTYDTIRVYRVDHETGWCEPVSWSTR